MMSKIHWLHHGLWQLCCTNVCPSPFYQCKVTLNTISPRMKSTPRVEVCCLLAADVGQVLLWTGYIESRHATCWFLSVRAIEIRRNFLIWPIIFKNRISGESWHIFPTWSPDPSCYVGTHMGVKKLISEKMAKKNFFLDRSIPLGEISSNPKRFFFWPICSLIRVS